MALDLTFKSKDVGITCYKEDKVPLLQQTGIKQDDNNNSMVATDLTMPGRQRQCDDIDISLISPPTPPTSTPPTLLTTPLPTSTANISQEQIQLDIAALNLLCLARLQETAAVLTGRRPMPAHLNSSSPSSIPLVTSSNSNRRNHKCDEPGCDKVIIIIFIPFMFFIHFRFQFSID